MGCQTTPHIYFSFALPTTATLFVTRRAARLIVAREESPHLDSYNHGDDNRHNPYDDILPIHNSKPLRVILEVLQCRILPAQRAMLPLYYILPSL